MSPDKGHDLAAFQRPGIRIIMGAQDCREEWIKPLGHNDLKKLPGDWSWEVRRLRLMLGFVPSLWAQLFGGMASLLGHDVSVEDWRWLNGPASILDARAWIDGIAEKQKSAKGEK